MAKRSSSTAEPPEDASAEGTTGRATYRERSEEASAIAGLGLLLVAMKPTELDALSLPPELAEAVVQCQGFTKGARARQLRLIGKLIRQIDHEELRTAVTHVMRGKGARSQREKTYESWRERLLTGGDAALTELVAKYRDADAQRLRQLVRTATREGSGGKGKHAARELLRCIRELGEANAEPSSDPSTT